MMLSDFQRRQCGNRRSFSSFLLLLIHGCVMLSDSLDRKKTHFISCKAAVINPYVGRKNMLLSAPLGGESFCLLIIKSKQCLDCGCGKSRHFTPIMYTLWGNYN